MAKATAKTFRFSCMRFSEEQNRALQSVSRWLQSSDRQVFRLFGYAGTGKTTLAKHLAKDAGSVMFAAYTGKATHVLQQKGCNAQTIHSLIYIPRPKSMARLSALREKLKNTDPDHPLAARLREEIKGEEENAKRPAFTLNLDSPLKDIDLLVIDEVSMINAEMGHDLESFGCKILVLGDPAQLPPVFGAGYFIDCEPDFMLTDIHRQAKDNPIIELATMIRQHNLPAKGNYGASSVIPRAAVTPELMLEADQILVGKNVTRQRFNDRLRELKGFDGGGLPVEGDRLVCLKNDANVGLLNGALWDVTNSIWEDPELMLDIVPDTGGSNLQLLVHPHYFRGEKPGLWEMKEASHFDYGYALTCHKAQGSQWNDVVVYDERMMGGNDYYRWLYTAVTRAAEKVCLIQ